MPKTSPITDLFLQVQQEIGQLQNWRQAMSQIGYKIQVDPQRSGMPSPAYSGVQWWSFPWRWKFHCGHHKPLAIHLECSKTSSTTLTASTTLHGGHGAGSPSATSPWLCRRPPNYGWFGEGGQTPSWRSRTGPVDQLRTSSFTPVITERWETYGQTPEGIQDSKQINLRKANKSVCDFACAAHWLSMEISTPSRAWSRHQQTWTSSCNEQLYAPVTGTTMWSFMKILQLIHYASPSALTNVAYRHYDSTPLIFSILAGTRCDIPNARGKTPADFLRKVSWKVRIQVIPSLSETFLQESTFLNLSRFLSVPVSCFIMFDPWLTQF